MDIGKKIRLLRKSKGLKQEYLAEKLNITINAISQYETGKRNVDIDTIKKISELFDVPTDYLIEDDISLDDIKVKAGGEVKSGSQPSINYTMALLKSLVSEGIISSLDDIKDEHLEALIQMLKQDANILLKEKGST